jgi:hypothetical protein
MTIRVATEDDPGALIELYGSSGVEESQFTEAEARAHFANFRTYPFVLSSNLSREQAHRFYEALGFEKHGYSYRVVL